MKRSLKVSVISIILAILVILIFIIDIAFYRLISFIKVFSYEREILVALVIVCIYAIEKGIFNRLNLNLKRRVFLLYGGLFFINIVLLLPQLLFRKHLILWDNNPFLAEYPTVWNIVSTISSILVLAAIILLLLDIRSLCYHRAKHRARLHFRLLIALIVIFTFVLTLVENRYTFQPIKVFPDYIDFYMWIIISALVGLYILNSLNRSWIDELRKDEKIVAFTLGVIALPLCIYIFFSHFIAPVYAYGITSKGFVFSSLGFILCYSTFSTVRLMFRIPTASLYDQIIDRMDYVKKINQLIASDMNLDLIINKVTDYILKATNSDTCWIEIVDKDREKFEIKSSSNLSSRLKSKINSGITAQLIDEIKLKKEPLLISDAIYDSRTTYFKMLGIPWKTILAVPLVQKKFVYGILWIAREKSSYNKVDLDTLDTFTSQLNMLVKYRGTKNNPLSKNSD